MLLIKNIKLQSVPPSMPSESQSVRLTEINSASNGIDRSTDCNFILFSIKYKYFDQSLVCFVYSIDMIYEYTTHYQNHNFFNWDISHHEATGI